MGGKYILIWVGDRNSFLDRSFTSREEAIAKRDELAGDYGRYTHILLYASNEAEEKDIMIRMRQYSDACIEQWEEFAKQRRFWRENMWEIYGIEEKQ